MRAETPLWRQIHPSWMQGDMPGSQAFRPSPKDDHRLSVEDGDRIDAEASWRRFTEVRHLSSLGVLGILMWECTAESLGVEPDGMPDPEHVSIDFTGKSHGQRKTISKKLRDLARVRGWQYRPEVGP